MKRLAVAFVLAVSVAASGLAQRPAFSNGVRQFIKVDAPLVVIRNVRVIDGTGSAPSEAQAVLIRDDRILAVGDDATLPIPPDAVVIDGTGKTVLPGLVMVHEHFYYPNGSGVYAQLGESFTRLYLAGGVTSLRTGGNVNGFMDLNLKSLIERGQKAGPAIDATAPYLNGPNSFVQMHTLEGVEDARRQVEYWADMGATSFKAYMQIGRAELGAAIEAAHARGLKVTGHLCSVTYAEAAALGIDNLEHGFAASTDFVTDKQPDQCPGQGGGQQTILDLDPEGPEFKALVQTLIDADVALTSTLTVFETFTPGRPMPEGVDLLVPELREQYIRTWNRTAGNENSRYRELFPKLMQLEKAFVDAGGTLIAGTDPTGSGGVIPGYSNQRMIELLVEAGFSPVAAIRIGTLNGATYLGRADRIGRIASGMQADLMLVTGNPALDITDIRQVDTVFRMGVGFDPVKLIESVAGRVGLW